VRTSAIALGGVVMGASILENSINAPVAVLANDPSASKPPDGEPSALLAAALVIDENRMSCRDQGVNLSGNVQHTMTARISGNEITGCVDVGIATLGVAMPGSSTTISGNNLIVSGSGIRCGVDGLWIQANKLTNTAKDTAARVRAAGIALVGGADKNGADQCQILANQVAGFAEAGILIASPTRDLLIKLNIIEDCGNGIMFAEHVKAGAVSIENNHLRNIGKKGESRPVVGIGVARAEAATISGNTIRTLGVQTEIGLRAAILTFGVLRVRVSGNEVTEVAPPGDFGEAAAGIMLLAPYTQFEVSHNQVQRDAAPSTQPSNGRWWALLSVDIDQQQPLSHFGGFATVRVDASRVLVVGAGRPYLSTLTETVAAAAPVRHAARSWETCSRRAALHPL
jgi:hypothetical protein